jgi:hypothetical protein
MRCQNQSSFTPDTQARLNAALDSLLMSLSGDVVKQNEIEKLKQTAKRLQALGLSEDQIVRHVTKGADPLPVSKTQPRRRVRHDRQGRPRKLSR